MNLLSPPESLSLRMTSIATAAAIGAVCFAGCERDSDNGSETTKHLDRAVSVSLSDGVVIRETPFVRGERDGDLANRVFAVALRDNDTYRSASGHVMIATPSGLSITENGAGTWYGISEEDLLATLRPDTAESVAVTGAQDDDGVLWLKAGGATIRMKKKDQR